MRTESQCHQGKNVPPFFISQLTVKALHVRPESGRSPQECCLRVSLMPLRLNIDQVRGAGVLPGTSRKCLTHVPMERLHPVALNVYLTVTKVA